MKTTLIARAFLAAIAFSAIASFAHAQEMMWDRKTVSQWIELANDPTPATREQAANVLGYFGDDARSAIPVLTKLLDDKDAGVREAAGRRRIT